MTSHKVTEYSRGGLENEAISFQGEKEYTGSGFSTYGVLVVSGGQWK